MLVDHVERVLEEDGMTTSVSLSVNNSVIDTDYFVAEFIHRVVNGILLSLRGACEIQTLHLTINESGEVSIDLNNTQVPLNPFVQQISRGTVVGMVSTLKGVGEVKTLDLTIKR